MTTEDGIVVVFVVDEEALTALTREARDYGRTVVQVRVGSDSWVTSMDRPASTSSVAWAQPKPLVEHTPVVQSVVAPVVEQSTAVSTPVLTVADAAPDKLVTTPLRTPTTRTTRTTRTPVVTPQQVAVVAPSATPQQVAVTAPSVTPQQLAVDTTPQPRLYGWNTPKVSTPAPVVETVVETPQVAVIEPVVEAAPVAVIEPVVETTQVAVTAPIVETTQVAVSKPVVESTPVAVAKPVVESTPIVKYAPATAASVGARTKPGFNTPPAVESQPIVKSEPVTETTNTTNVTVTEPTQPVAQPTRPTTTILRPTGPNTAHGYTAYGAATGSQTSVRIKSTNRRATTLSLPRLDNSTETKSTAPAKSSVSKKKTTSSFWGPSR